MVELIVDAPPTPGTIAVQQEVDSFFVQIDQPGRFRVHLRAESEARMILTLRNQNGDKMDEQAGTAPLLEHELTVGKYYVFAACELPSGTGSYRIGVSQP